MYPKRQITPLTLASSSSRRSASRTRNSAFVIPRSAATLLADSTIWGAKSLEIRHR
jgi:hypothetical protein